MIHDLDVCLSLVGGDVTAIEAVGVPVLTGRVDIANARLRFETGCIANVTASRISKDRVRKIRFFQPSAYVSVDYGAQELEVWRLVQNRTDCRAPMAASARWRTTPQARARGFRARRRRTLSARVPGVGRRARTGARIVDKMDSGQ
jgi:hypothetical protein